MTQETNDVVGRVEQAIYDHWSAPPIYGPSSFREAALAAIEACDQSRSARIAELEPKAVSYDHAHEDAVEMGYPSLTEALEHLDELRAALNKDSTSG